MAMAWSEWTDRAWATASPYVDWYHTVPPGGLTAEHSGSRAQMALHRIEAFAGGFKSFLRTDPLEAKSAPAPSPEKDEQPTVPEMDDVFGELEQPKVPLPAPAINEGFATHYLKAGSWAPDDKDVPVVMDPDTVIVGIIDTGIALGHDRFRDADGKTRFLAAWQQVAATQAQPYLPFGAELYRDDIDDLLRKHSVGGVAGHLNEANFNTAAGLVNMADRRGHRELAGRYAHGTTVADLAFGDKPGSADKRIGVIAINLPDRDTVHSSGIFLDYFAIYGIKRIADMADLIFSKSRAAALKRKDPRVWPEHRFPIVINLSFGKNAGAKDGGDFFSAAVRTINDERTRNKVLPVQMVIPIGNHNLERGCAEVMLPSGAKDEVTFVTQPEDQTPNFLEVWTERLEKAPGSKPGDVALPLEIAVIPPGGKRAAVMPVPSSGRHLTSRTLGADLARLYCRVRVDADNAGYKVGYLLCTAPTLWQESPRREASPSGRWTIVLRNAGTQALRVYLSAQTDQSVLPRSGTARVPHFERADYEAHLHPSGRLRDSYAYPYVAGANLDTSTVLRRHGSLNAMSTGNEVVAVAGFRLSDGRPAVYSSTGHGYKLDTNSRANPTVAFPTDESPAHFGLLGSGAANGSVVAMRGTSFASALATRWIVRSILDKSVQLPAVIGDISAAAQKQELSKPAHYPGATPPQPKIGHGRIGDRPARLARTMHPP